MKNKFLLGIALGANLVLGTLFLSGLTSTQPIAPEAPVASSDEVFSSEPFLGQVTIFAGNFAPRGWAFCEGQLLPISQNTALFSILGTTYGGDGRTTFALPDLRGRAVMHPRQGPGLSNYRLGQKGGNETGTLIPGRAGSFMVSGNTGRSQSISNMQPYQTLNYIIALQGVFPSRS